MVSANVSTPAHRLSAGVNGVCDGSGLGVGDGACAGPSARLVSGFRALAARTYPKGFGDKIPPNLVIGLILSQTLDSAAIRPCRHDFIVTVLGMVVGATTHSIATNIQLFCDSASLHLL